SLQRFDAALAAYTFATLFAVSGLTYRYSIWLQRPATALYWRCGWQVPCHNGSFDLDTGQPLAGPPRRTLSHPQECRSRRRSCALCLLIVILQLWLLTATMEAFLGGEHPIVIPAALASLGCFALNFGLLFRYRRELER
ncbi:MAG: DUF6755 family protein, partial [Bryobacteraceae bacterium]